MERLCHWENSATLGKPRSYVSIQHLFCTHYKQKKMVFKMHLFSYEELYTIRMAFQVYENADTKGMPCTEKYLLRAFKVRIFVSFILLAPSLSSRAIFFAWKSLCFSYFTSEYANLPFTNRIKFTFLCLTSYCRSRCSLQ